MSKPLSYDVVLNPCDFLPYPPAPLSPFLKGRGVLVTAHHPPLPSDSLGVLMGGFFSVFRRLQQAFSKVRNQFDKKYLVILFVIEG